MNNVDWYLNLFDNKVCQKHLEEKIQVLISMYFQGKDEYIIEKFIKSFSEGLRYLEKLMLIELNTHVCQNNHVNPFSNIVDSAQKYRELEKSLLNEIDRQFRHYITFLSAITQ